ncbi:hypothetical protein [Streptomyces alfalfae]|uniref:hypothetical protein n=1 Tax=Streptomyces alfalfae TaxID=1642299 RepID=UPI002811E69D|nr:hypothetical protein [Streptomyces alfalfae]
MAASQRTSLPPDPGNAWLAEHTTNPELTLAAWESRTLMPVHATQWLVAEVQLQPAMAAVRRMPEHKLGPILIDMRMDRAWWLVPLDAADHLKDVPQALVLPPGWPLHCPSTQLAVGSRAWLEAPDGSGRLNDPVYLAAALGPGGGPRLPAEAFG